MTSVFNALLIKLQERLVAAIPDSVGTPGIRYVEQDLGQLDFYATRPAISFPAVLVDYTVTTYEQKQMKTQWAQLSGIQLRLAFDPLSNTSSLTPLQVREKGLQYFEIEQKIYLTLQDWTADGLLMLPMKRISAATEERQDPFRVRRIGFKSTYEDRTLQEGSIIVPPINPVAIRLEWESPGNQNYVYSQRLVGITKEHIQQVSYEGDDKFFVVTEGGPTDKQVRLDNVAGRLIFKNDLETRDQVWCQVLNS